MIRFNRRQLIESQENCFKYKAKDILSLLIIAQIVALVVSILLVILVSYASALVVEAAIMSMTSCTYVNESRKLERIRKGEKQRFQSMEMTIGEHIMVIEGQLCADVDTDEKALSFATISRADNLRIIAKNTENEIETTEIKIEANLYRKTSNHDVHYTENMNKSKKNKRVKTAKDINYTDKTDISKYSVTYFVELKEIKKAREHKGFLVIVMNDRSEIKVPIDNENKKFYEKLALVSGINYKIIL